MVPPELGVGALERRVTVRLGLLDTMMPACQSLQSTPTVCTRPQGRRGIAGARSVSSRK
jgi:hypothetical protein